MDTGLASITLVRRSHTPPRRTGRTRTTTTSHATQAGSNTGDRAGPTTRGNLAVGAIVPVAVGALAHPNTAVALTVTAVLAAIAFGLPRLLNYSRSTRAPPSEAPKAGLREPAFGIARLEVILWFRAQRFLSRLHEATKRGPTSVQVVALLEELANALLERGGTGAPRVRVTVDSDLGAAVAGLTWNDKTIRVRKDHLAHLAEVVISIIHEVRHVEQKHLIDLYKAGRLSPKSSEFQAAALWHKSLEGSGRAYSQDTLAHAYTSFDRLAEAQRQYDEAVTDEASADERETLERILADATEAYEAARAAYNMLADEADALAVEHLYHDFGFSEAEKQPTEKPALPQLDSHLLGTRIRSH
jgi:hypothetical protein